MGNLDHGERAKGGCCWRQERLGRSGAEENSCHGGGREAGSAREEGGGSLADGRRAQCRGTGGLSHTSGHRPSAAWSHVQRLAAHNLIYKILPQLDFKNTRWCTTL